ncbi:MAG: HAMP domain-containing sensor histidine kinase [Longicatena sp.]
MRYRDISIRKKILLSNFLMILIPVIFVCIIFSIILFGFSFLTNSSSSLIRNVLLNSSNYGPTLLIKSLNDEVSDSTTITTQAKTIFAQLEEINLHIMVKENDSIVYLSNGYTSKDIETEFYQIAKTKEYESPYILWNQNGMAYEATLQNKANKNMTLTFTGVDLSLPKDSYVSWEQTKLVIKVTIIGTGSFMILFILLLGIFLTRKLSRYILQPLAQLQIATNEIKEGNLSSSISSSTQDEFGVLCENFENMREQLVASDQIQKQYLQQRKELIAGISHDLSTPLTSIQGYVNGLLDGVANTPEKQQHYLQIIQSKTKHMNDLVESLFLLSKLDMGEESLQTELLDLNAFMIQWVEEEQAKYEEQSLLLSFVPSTSPCYVMMDTSLFIRVLDNLCDNSIKYKRNDIVHMDIHLTKDKNGCLISFQDDGIGAQQEDIQRLFERFYRADPARSSKIKGNGLGLSITRHIIEQMKGTIWAQGEINKGLCISIQLPTEEVQ